ncbi:competence type IV pilus ATPase ComGA [Lactococcus termiticola]|uniref:Competence protein ComGA n=1 Tax=Lactococcus termiticola TaxID=2169526 RepID=A0A2R5HEP0_9LACT|nr:competence type IV pilus ATPase ComGA [Lactococcus termiticola]GBG96502.1 competence protein ComGA [Lactococcus termiticola]
MEAFEAQIYAKNLLEEAVSKQVQDIYLLPLGDHYQIYFRTAFTREESSHLPAGEALALMSHLKFLAGMNLGEHRRSQLGATSYELSESQVRLRLSTVGDFRGHESMVIRLLPEAGQQSLHYWDDSFFAELPKAPGLYLFAGPVGSGKTSLMYQLARKDFAGRQIMTIEDPVEIREEAFLQLQLNSVIGSDYESLIKLALRHRPELLIVGEIRDPLTARMVFRASLTGMTVFSSIHAGSIPGVISRLRDFGLRDWEIKASLKSVLYQRLIAGKGLVDLAKENFETKSPEAWNQKLSELHATGHLTAHQLEAEQIKPERATEADSADG